MSAPEGIQPHLWQALRTCRLWSRASDEAVAALARGALVRDASPGERIIQEGAAATHFGVIVSGQARVYYLGADGRRITFETLNVTDPVAAVAALAGGRYPANVDAVTASAIAWLARDALFDVLDEEPEVARSLIADLASHVVNFTSVVHTLALDVPGRLASYLFQRSLQSGRRSERGVEIDLGMKKAELAAALGTVPETLSRALARLRDEGIIDFTGADVVILDVRRLAALGSGYDER
jgi:CRP-like cAMP-binding protein